MALEVLEIENIAGLNTSFARQMKLAAGLLQPGEAAVPESVQQTIRFLCERGIRFRLSRNREARSCRDAAQKRNRLGHEGIPLCDELKSYFGTFINAAGHQQPFLAHCRGDRLLDIDLLRIALNAREIPNRMSEDEINGFGLEYGLVNPFGLNRSIRTLANYTWDARFLTTPILQVFDQELTERIGIPGSVMTNAGDLTWAVDFFADELVKKIDNVVIEKIAIGDTEGTPRPWGTQERKIIGIITGNAPESGILLWNYINQQIREALGQDCYGDISMPQVIVYSLPDMGLSMELDEWEAEVWIALRSAVIDLGRRGVRLLTIADNTTQYFTTQIRKLCEEFKTEFISLPEVLAEWLVKHGKQNVALVGISYVAELGQWSAYRKPLQNFSVEKLSETAKDQIHELAYQVKTEGVTEAGLNRLRDILRREVVSDTVILALTELSLLLQKQKSKGRSGKTLIDPLKVYSEAIIARYLNDSTN